MLIRKCSTFKHTTFHTQNVKVDALFGCANKMKRIHLFEFEDQKWFPAFLRNYGTDFLQFLSGKTKMYKPILPIIKKGLEKSKTNQIIDLGSGGGGGLIWLNAELIKDIPNLKITLTDAYPNISAFKFTKAHADNFEYIEKPVSYTHLTLPTTSRV